jgi:hypothetical protein
VVVVVVLRLAQSEMVKPVVLAVVLVLQVVHQEQKVTALQIKGEMAEQVLLTQICKYLAVVVVLILSVVTLQELLVVSVALVLHRQ